MQSDFPQYGGVNEKTNLVKHDGLEMTTFLPSWDARPCNDVLWAILFLISLIGVPSIAVVFGSGVELSQDLPTQDGGSPLGLPDSTVQEHLEDEESEIGPPLDSSQVNQQSSAISAPPAKTVRFSTPPPLVKDSPRVAKPSPQDLDAQKLADEAEAQIEAVAAAERAVVDQEDGPEWEPAPSTFRTWDQDKVGSVWNVLDGVGKRSRESS
eukprot:gb/GEZN01013462.1/.p1 GENE.gb/GEZN01013462.1/~~gb/GEZN01013462.1/.p1  ORF type:complete len:227 (-),score=42.07 gb/GEZN01013462.1/:333-962(-)